MDNPTEAPQEPQEGANACAPTHARSQGNQAVLERLWARHRETAAALFQQEKERARKKAAARNRKYRQARAHEREEREAQMQATQELHADLEPLS